MAGLGLDNILDFQEIDNLFGEQEDEVSQETPGTEPEEEKETDKEEDKTTEVVESPDLFGDDELQPESVGSEKKDKEEKGEEDTSTQEGSNTSPNFYSSIANALAVDGIFPNLDEETIKKVTDAEGLSDIISAEVQARFDSDQQRILKALDNGVEPSDIKKYESTLRYINSITEAQLKAESEAGERLRYNIIYQDYLNKGYSEERAKKYTERAIDTGTDVEDAKDALQSNKEYFQQEYDKLLEDAQKAEDARIAEERKNAEKLKDSIMKDKDLFGDMEISQDTRKKVYDTIMRPVYKDPETGDYLTALQKYEKEHRADFLKYVGLMMTLTNGFKDFDSFTKGKVKKEVKKGLRELEQTLSGTKRDSGGNLRMADKTSDDPESYLGKGFRLAL